MITVKRPRLLDSNLNEIAPLTPLGLQLNLQTPGVSTAALTLSPNDAEPAMHDWVELFNQNGFVGYYRVTVPATDYSQQTTLTLRHGIDCLADAVLEAQEDYKGPPSTLLTRLFAAQKTKVLGVNPWALGTCAATDDIEININYPKLNDLLSSIETQLENYLFVYDQTVFPWVVNVIAKPANADGEFRLNRNVETLSRTLNDNNLCTQLILSINSKATVRNVTTNKTLLKTYNNTAAQQIYGIVQKTADIDTKDDLTVQNPTTPEADAWAARFLNDNAAPTVQIQITGRELSRVTCDTWDEAKLGHIYRVAIPRYNQVFEERVVAINYPDALNQPDIVNISLANQQPKFSSTIASLREEVKRVGGGGRAAARNAADADQLEVWSQTVQYYGEALDGTGVLTLYESGIDMNPLGGVTIYSLEEGVQSLYSGIQVNTQAITLKVSKGEVGTQLAVECGNVHISGTPGAANLVVDGYVTADSIFSSSATHYDVYAADLYADSITLSGTGLLDAESVVAGSITAVDEFYIGGNEVTNIIIDASVSQDGRTLTLTPLVGSPINFSKAGPITGISKVSQTWKPADFTYGGFDVVVDAVGANLTTYQGTISVDAAYAYSAGWATGYDDGVADGEAKFTQATVTPQGASETVYVSDSSGTEYYKKSGTSYNRLGTRETYKFYGSLYAPEGSGPSWVVKGTGTWYLWTGDHRDAYLYHVGSSVTPVDSSSKITIKSDTRYQEGTPDTTTYYTKSSS